MREEIIEAAKEVHEELGSGWSESIYHSALERELSERQIPFSSEGTVSVMYKGTPVGRRRPDLFVVDDTGTYIIELKAGSQSGQAQIEEYLNLVTTDDNFDDIAGGLLIQFNEECECSVFGDADDEIEYELLKSLDTGVDIYIAKNDEYSAQITVDETVGTIHAPEVTPDDEMFEFVERVVEKMEEDFDIDG